MATVHIAEGHDGTIHLQLDGEVWFQAAITVTPDSATDLCAAWAADTWQPNTDDRFLRADPALFSHLQLIGTWTDGEITTGPALPGWSGRRFLGTPTAP